MTVSEEKTLECVVPLASGFHRDANWAGLIMHRYSFKTGGLSH